MRPILVHLLPLPSLRHFMEDLRALVQASLGDSHTLERELGGGGMSRVFVATEHRFARRVVVKVLSPDLAAALSAERFEREIVLAASLQQANIVPVLSAGDANGLPYFTMPFVEGESLRARLGRGTIAVGEAVDILRDVAKALAYAHGRGVVHRDIKPDNVLLSGRTAVVTDFGIAKAIAAAQVPASGTTLTQLGTAVGTPAYMAPEQATGDPDTDHRADIYAFGCTAFELLAGHPPFHGTAQHRLLAAHMGEEAPSLATLRPDCPPALVRLVAQCLEKDPARRPASAEEVLHQLDLAVATSPGIAPALPGGRSMLLQALAIYALAFVGVAAVARVLVDRQGLPEWVFGGALIVMALGLPVILFTGYTYFVTRRMAVATPTLTPRGSVHPAQPRGTLAHLAVRASPHVSWMRTARGGAAAVGLFALLVVAFLVSRSTGWGPAASLLSSGRLEAQDGVLVAAFETSGPDSSLGNVVASAVQTNLSQSHAVRVVPTSTIVAALQRMERAPTERVTLALAREIAVREGIKAVVTGSIVPAGAAYLVTTRLVHAESGDELAAFRETATDASKLIATVDKLTRKLRGKIGESLKEVRDAPRLEQVTTASLPALRSYAEALRANDIEADFPKAIALFEDAIAKDTLFAAAYVQLAHTVGNARLQRPGYRDSLLTKAFTLRERLPDRERFAVEGVYYSAGVGAHRGRAITAFERAVQLDSSNADALNSLAIALTSARRYEEAERAYRAAMAAEPGNNLIQGNLAGLLLIRGKFGEADSVYQALRARAPGFPVANRAYQGLYMRGDLDSAEAAARAEIRREGSSNVGQATNFLVNLTRMRGRLRESAQLAQRLGALNSAQGRARPVLFDTLDAVMMDALYRNRPEGGARRIEAALRAQPMQVGADGARADALLNAARALAVVGSPARAQQVVEQVRRTATPEVRTRLRPFIEDVESEIAAADGRVADAITLLRKSDVESDGLPGSCAPCLPVLIGRLHDAANQPDSVMANYERYLTTYGFARISLDSWFRGFVLKRLGELHEARGDLAKAAGFYGEFVELWKDADAELQPEVRDVRRRLERIRARTG